MTHTSPTPDDSESAVSSEEQLYHRFDRAVEVTLRYYRENMRELN